MTTFDGRQLLMKTIFNERGTFMEQFISWNTMFDGVYSYVLYGPEGGINFVLAWNPLKLTTLTKLNNITIYKQVHGVLGRLILLTDLRRFYSLVWPSPSPTPLSLSPVRHWFTLFTTSLSFFLLLLLPLSSFSPLFPPLLMAQSTHS